MGGNSAHNELTIKTDMPATEDERTRWSFSSLLSCNACGGSRIKAGHGRYGGMQEGSAQTCGIRNARLSTVATSRVVSVSVLFTFRVMCFIMLIFGAAWLTWAYYSNQGDSPEDSSYQDQGLGPQPLLCLPDWSYVITALYFLMSAAACLRQTKAKAYTPHTLRALPASLPGSSSSSSHRINGDAADRSFCNTLTLFMLEVSVVFQTIVVPLEWVLHATEGERIGRATASTVALVTILVDLAVNPSRVEAKHVGLLLAVLLAWVLEQVLWVYTKDGHDACYEGVFDPRSWICLMTAAVTAIIVIIVTVGYSALCTQRDRFMAPFVLLNPGLDHTGADVEEDMGQEDVDRSHVSLPPPVRVPPNSERKSIVNPIFAGSGSRMNRGWPYVSGENPVAPMASSGTEISSGDEVASEWVADGEVNSSGRHFPRTHMSTGPAGGGGVVGEYRVPTPDSSTGGVGRRAEGGNGGMSTHPSSWVGYSGAAAWVRSSGQDAASAPRSTKGHFRRPPPRF